MSIFKKGNFRRPARNYIRMGRLALRRLSEFQNTFDIQDTDTTVNSIRDSIIAKHFHFDLVNMDKHGFDAKNSGTKEFLEVKQCSVSAKRWGGTWNDTNLEKAKAFSGRKLFTAVAVWKGADDLQFVVFGKSKKLGDYLKEKIKNRKNGSRSTQTISITKLIEWGFSVHVPPGKNRRNLHEQLTAHNKRLAKLVSPASMKRI